MGDAAPEDLPSAPAPSPRDTSAHGKFLPIRTEPVGLELVR